jgi:chemotaxis-related protein WspD
VPHRRGGVLLGIGSVEGDLLPVVSLAALLHPRGTAGVTTSERILLINWKQRRFAAPVEDVHGVFRYHPEELLPPPATLAAGSAFVSGLLPWRNHSVGLLNPTRLFDGLVRGVA